MTVHVLLQLNDKLTSATRVMVRLRALRVTVDELHVRDGAMCVHLTDADCAKRVLSVLDRLTDVEVADGSILAGCVWPHQERRE